MKQVFIIVETIINIFRNFMWNECLTLKDGDPCWMIQKTKISLQKKFQRCFQKKVLERLINEISNITVPIEPPQTRPILEFKGRV